MEIGAILLVLVVAVAAGVFITQPLQARARRNAKSVSSQDESALLAERERTINALQELDFDHVLGKVPAEDYPAQRAALVQRGAEILKKLDAISPSPVLAGGDVLSVSKQARGEGESDAEIESAIAARRADRARVGASNQPIGLDDDLEALIAARRSTRKNKSGGFCSRCGKPVLVSDRFCPNCGKAVG